MALYIHASFFIYDLRLCRALLRETVPELYVSRETADNVHQLLDKIIKDIEDGGYPAIDLSTRSSQA